MEVRSAAKLQCQRIGCNAMFTEDDNPDGSCQFHASMMICRLDVKEVNTQLRNLFWPNRLQDSSLSRFFLLHLQIPMQQQRTLAPDAAKASSAQTMVGSQPKEQTRQLALNTPVQVQEEKTESLAPVKKVVIDINQPQVCKNKGCGKTFKERDNHETACSYHPGPAVFHDRLRGWKCCDVHVKEFDEFMEIPPCTKGWHSSSADQAV
ncbi:hypothetical protein Bca4012_026983 [Brassica carinata]